MRRKRLNNVTVSLLFAIIIVGLFSGCKLLPKEEAALAPPLIVPKKQEYTLYKVVKKAIEKKYTASGTLVSESQSSVYFRDSPKRVRHINVKVGDIVKKGDVLVETEVGNIDTQVKIQEYNVLMNKIDYKDIKETGKESDIEKARLRLLIEQVKLEELKNQQQSSRLTSPINGQVVYVENLKDGEMVEPFTTIVTIGDPTKLMVNCDQDPTAISLGMKAKISVNGNNLEGIVVATPKSSTMSKDESAKKRISIVIDNIPKGLKIGDNANVEITLQSKLSTIVIPIAGLKTFSNNSVVEVWDGVSKKELAVQIGIKTATEVEIVSGVNEGQQIILN